MVSTTLSGERRGSALFHPLNIAEMGDYGQENRTGNIP